MIAGGPPGDRCDTHATPRNETPSVCDSDDIDSDVRLQQLRDAIDRLANMPTIETPSFSLQWSTPSPDPDPRRPSSATSSRRAMSSSTPCSSRRMNFSTTPTPRRRPRSRNHQEDAHLVTSELSQWKWQEKIRDVEQREARLALQRRELQRMREQITLKQAMLENAFLELRRRERDIVNGEQLLLEQRRKDKHRAKVDAMVIAAAQRGAGEEGLTVDVVTEAMQIYASAEAIISEGHAALRDAAERTWGEIREREAALEAWERRLWCASNSEIEEIQPNRSTRPLQSYDSFDDL